MTAAECIEQAVSLVHGLTFLLGVGCGFILAVGMFVMRKATVHNEQLDQVESIVSENESLMRKVRGQIDAGAPHRKPYATRVE